MGCSKYFNISHCISNKTLKACHSKMFIILRTMWCFGIFHIFRFQGHLPGCCSFLPHVKRCLALLTWWAGERESAVELKELDKCLPACCFIFGSRCCQCWWVLWQWDWCRPQALSRSATRVEVLLKSSQCDLFVYFNVDINAVSRLGNVIVRDVSSSQVHEHKHVL